MDTKSFGINFVQKPMNSNANSRQVAGAHYINMGVTPWDVIDTWPIEQRIGYYRGCALKYIMRCGHKDEQTQELGKAIHCLEKLIETLKGANEG